MKKYSAYLVSLTSVSLIGITILFVTLPLVAIVFRTAPSTLFNQLSTDIFLSALRVSLISTTISHLLILLIGTPVAFLLSTNKFKGRTTIITLLELPIILPPAVAGLGLLAAFGRKGLLGSTFSDLGFSIPFTLIAVIMAATFVAAPLYIRQATAAFDAIDTGYIETARTLGKNQFYCFTKVAIPLALPNLQSGAALSLARGFGEFGATIMFAGSLQGKTQTLPLAVYTLMDSNFDAALALACILMTFGVALIVTNRWMIQWTTSRFN